MNTPTYIKEKYQNNWNQVNNHFGGGEQGIVAANTWYKKTLANDIEAYNHTQVREVISFDVDNSQSFIKRAENGDEYISFKLADVNMDKFGVQLPEFLLRTWEAQINENPIVGDIDHEEYDRLLQAGFTDEEVKTRLKDKPSIAKTVRAVFQKGKLWVRAVLDKRYRELIQKSKGVSLEAIITRDNDGNVVSGDLLGFTFGVKHNPVIDGTEVHHGTA